MNLEDLKRKAHAAALAGQTWRDFTWNDSDVEAAACEPGFDGDSLESSFCDGLRQRRLTVEGWRHAWTTAPIDYDSFGTETTDAGGPWRGKTIRQVMIDPGHYAYQTSRYGSGCHPSLDEDPRVTDAQAEERAARDRAERETREAKRQAGLTWLANVATDDDLEDFDTFEARGVTFADVKAEKARRVAKVEADKQATEWARCRAIIVEGSTVVDDGEPSIQGKYGRIPGREPHAWHSVKIEVDWRGTPDESMVVGEGRDTIACVSLVADWLASGRLRVAEHDSVAPYPVLKRIGHSQWNKIRSVTVDGRTVWVGRATFGETMVLDDAGHLVRSKKILNAALRVSP